MFNRSIDRRLRGSMLNIQFDLRRNFLCHERPSLKQIAVRKYCLSVWDSFINEITSSSDPASIENLFLTFPYAYVEKANEKLKSPSLLKYCKDVLFAMNDELYFFLNKLKNLKLSCSSDGKALYLRNIKWTSQCTVDRPISVLSLIENSDISTFDKYKLASHFCLKDQVGLLLEQLPDLMMNIPQDDDFLIMFFWIFHAVNKDKQFFNISSKISNSNISSYEDLLINAIENDNGVAVYYIWKNFMTNKRKDFMTYIENAMLLCSNNVLLYLLSQVTRSEDIEDICIELGYEILEKLSDDNRFHIYFMEVVKYVLPHIKHFPFIQAFIILSLCWKKDASEREKYKMLVQELACLDRYDIKVNFIFSTETIIDLLLSAKDKFWELGKDYGDQDDNDEEDDKVEEEMRKAEESVKMVLRIESVEDGRKLLNSASGMKMCMDFLDDADILVKFMEEMLPEESWAQYKRNFLEEKGIEICYNAFKGDPAFISFDLVLDAFCEEGEVAEYKKRLPYQQQGKIIGDILKETTHSDPDWMKRVDKFLKWCFEDNKTEIYNCKTILFNPEVDVYSYCCQIFVNQICRLVKLRNHSRAEKYLKWVFETEDNVRQYKKKVASEMQKPKSDRKLKVNFIYYEKQKDLFISFFH